jgi:hypothetical protein
VTRGFLWATGLVLLLRTPGVSGAQSPWTVAVIPTLNPLPITFCGAVQLRIVDPTTRDAPRGPTGARVTIADFDMTVTAPGGASVVGHAIDVSHWEVCACQGATVGTVGTITATYPAQALSERARVSGITFQTTATFSLAKAMGETNPPACQTRSLTAVIAAGGTPTTPVASSLAPRTVTPTSILERAPAGSGVLAPPLSAAPAGARAPANPAAGPPPTNVAVSGTPLIARVTWTAAPGATRYAVLRKDDAQPSVVRTPAAFTATEFTETLPDPRITYRYTVIAYYADGTSGEATSVQYVSPPLVNPTRLTVEHLGLGEVQLMWQPVPGAISYRLDGPGLPGTGLAMNTTSHGYTAPWGAASWKVTALYPGNFADYVNGATVSTVIRVLPAHPGTWLTKSNGPGTAAEIQTPRRPGCDFEDWYCPGPLSPAVPPGLIVPWDGIANSWLGFGVYPGLLSWLNVQIPLWDNPDQWGNEAVYGNLGDLGFGRRTACWQGARPPPNPAFVTICYAAAHGAAPGEPGFADPDVVTHPVEGMGDGFILSMMIVKDPTGSVFMAFGPGGSPRLQYRLLPEATLDTEGPKFIPFACLSCHGGKYNPQTRKVEGAQLLPLDPGLLAFASPAAKAGEQEKIRQINQMIVNSDPQSAVAAYIRGLYSGALSQPGAQAVDEFVPQGWAPQTGFYRSVVKPYCAMCHIAGPTYLNFASWQNFEDNKALIHAAVCRAKTMPHAELQFKAFWTRDTGPTYTPGLLAATLGYPSCQ